jgi:hypothetical protein
LTCNAKEDIGGNRTIRRVCVGALVNLKKVGPVNQQKGEFQPMEFIRLQALWRKPF